MKAYLVKLNILKNIPEQINSLVKLSLEDLQELNFEQFVSPSQSKQITANLKVICVER